MIMPFQCVYCQHTNHRLGEIGCRKHDYKFPNDNDKGADCKDLSYHSSLRKGE